MSVNSDSNKRIAILVAALLLSGAWVALHLLTLDRYLHVSCDESFYSQIAYHFAREGNFGTSSMLGMSGADRNVVWPGRLYIGLLAVSQAIFGPTHFSGRMVSLLAGLAGAFMLYRLGRRLYGLRVGVAAALIYLLAWKTLLATHYGRPEALMAAAAIGETWLLWESLERPNFLRGFLAGLGAVFLLDVHPNLFSFAFAASIVTLAYFGRRRDWRAIGAFATGSLAGLAYWLPAHLLPDVPAALDQVFTVYSGQGLTPWQQSGRESLLHFYWKEFVARDNHLSAFSAVYFAAGILWTAMDKSRPSRFLIGLIALANLAFALIPVKEWFYATLWMPFLSLMVAAGIERLAARPDALGPLSRFSQRAVWLAALLPLILTFLAGDLHLLYKFSHRTFPSYFQQLRDAIPAGATMVAENTWWFARPDEPFVTDNETINWLEAQAGTRMTPATFTSFLNQTVPSFVVVDGVLGCVTEPPAAYEPLYPIVAENCEYVSTVRAEGYVDSDIYYCENPIP